MPVSISIPFDRSLSGNQAVQRTIWNAARMVRDLWLSRAPHISGAYAQGLQHPSSVTVKPGEIVITNFAKHASYYEDGTRAFNWGMQFLMKGGPKVKRDKEGFRYAVIKIDPKGKAAFRKEGVGKAIIAAFQGTLPRGRTKFPDYNGVGDIARYTQRKSLSKPLKPKAPGKGAMKGFFVVSERAIRENPKRWFHEAKEGYKLAADVKAATEPLVIRALAKVVVAEAVRMLRRRR